MASTHQVLRLLGAAMILIALSLAPSVASAHAGHDHGSAPVASDTQPSKGVSHTEAASTSIANFDAHLPRGCTGQCCSSAPCTACCAVAAATVSQPSPPLGHVIMGLRNPDRLWQLHPDGLRRPPRFFA
jgi:hypothetical protein